MNENYSVSLNNIDINHHQRVSRLYSIQPMGCGLPRVESLISYISRLATAHCVPTGLLIVKEVAPLIKAAYSFTGKTHEGGLDKIFANQTRAINGFGDWASGVVNAVENLTYRTDLSQLTLLSWRKAIPARNLLKQQRAWCPLCFKESLDNSQTLYEPLYWNLEVLEFCPTHKTPLSNTCPHCKKGNRPLSWYGRPGFCSKCRGWLGIDAYTSNLSGLEFKAVRDHEKLHCIKCVNDLFCMSPDSFSDKVNISVAGHLCHSVENVPSGKSAHLARTLGTSITQVERWRKGISTPTLASMINICHKLELDFPTLLKPPHSETASEICGLDRNCTESNEKLIPCNPVKKITAKQKLVTSVLKVAILENPPPSVNDIAARLGYRTSSVLYHYDSEACKRVAQRFKDAFKEKQGKFIQEILKRALDEYPPRPLEEIADESGIDSHTLKVYEKSFCKQISNNYAQFRKQKKVERIEVLFEEMKRIACSLHSQGIKPTPSRVSLHLSSPGSILQSEPREKLEQFLRENEWI